MTDISSWKIVLIDDEEDIRDVMTVALSDAGYDVLTAADGVTGLQRCETFSPQIVITDIRMPGLDGLQVLESLKKRFPDIEVIVATAMFTDIAGFSSVAESMTAEQTASMLNRYFSDVTGHVFETGGSTGVPKSRINIEDFQKDYELFGDALSDETFPPGSDWLMLGPTGPRRLRLAIEHLAQHRGGTAFFVDLDPRWVNKMIRMGRHQDVDLYKEHVIAQALTILRAHDDIHCIFSTPKLLEALAEKISLVKPDAARDHSSTLTRPVRRFIFGW